MTNHHGGTASPANPDPKSADDFNQHGWSQYSKKDFSSAEANFRKALSFFPENPEYLYGLAMSLSAAGRQQEAVAAFEQVIQGLENPPDELKVRFHMLARFARGHINRIRTGDWLMR